MKILSLIELSVAHCRHMKENEAFSRADIETQLVVLPEWKLQDHAQEGKQSPALVRTYSFKNYYETLAFVNAIAWMIHQQDHHPELNVSYGRCTVRFNTHSAAGISLNDFICAARCDAIYGQ